MLLNANDRTMYDLKEVLARVQVAEAALELRDEKEAEADLDAYEHLSAEILKEVSIARAALSRFLDLVAEGMCHDTVAVARANERASEQAELPELPLWVNGEECRGDNAY